MNGKRFSKVAVFAAGSIFLFTVPGMVRAENTPHRAMQAPKTAAPAAQPKADTLPPDDFAGLNYTDDQKAEIEKIHQDTEAHKTAVIQDDKLTADQKGAMLLGYSRMEYGQRFRVLSPEQRRQVQKKILARRAADQAEQRKQPPLN